MLDHVLTLIGKAPGVLDSAVTDAVRAALWRLGAETGPPDWLAPGLACDIGFALLHPDQAAAAARQALGDRPADALAQARAGRVKRLLVADMESTLIRNEMLDELAAEAGIGERIAGITRAAMNGELDFEAALRERVALLAGLPVTILAVAAARIEPMPGARSLVATMRRHGATTVLVSGGFRCFTGLVRVSLGLDLDLANDLLVEDGRLTGRVAEPILGRHAKHAALIRLASEHRVPLAATLAVGDGANDIDLLDAAGLGIAFHAKPAVAAHAGHRIDHADLTALLYAQGYRQDELVD
jgi:phosphoserine phosphatase